MAPHTAQGHGHGLVAALIHIEIFQSTQLRTQVAAPVISGILHQVHSVLAAVGVAFRIVVQQAAAAGAEIQICVVLRHTGGHQSLGGLCRNPRHGGQLLPVDHQTQGLADGFILQTAAVEHDGVSLQNRLCPPGLVRFHLLCHLLLRQRPDSVYHALIIQDLRRLRVSEAEGQILRTGQLFAVGGIFRQRQSIFFLCGGSIGTIGHQTGGIGPPATGRLILFQIIVGGIRLLLESLYNILPQRHGGDGGADLPQEPVIMTGQGHHKGGAAFCAHRQQTHVAGGLSLRIAADNGQQRGIHGAGGGVRQTLPGVYKVAGLDLYAIGPLAAPEAEGVGDGAIAVLLHVHAFGGTGDCDGLAVFARFQPHQIFIKVVQDGLVPDPLGVDRIIGGGGLTHADGERCPAVCRFLPAAGGQEGNAHQSAETQRCQALP